MNDPNRAIRSAQPGAGGTFYALSAGLGAARFIVPAFAAAVAWMAQAAFGSDAASAPATGRSADPPGRPNIVFILCDDLGYGDVRCFNPAGKIATPSFDRLAAQGIRCTDAHSSSSVCTPTRYSLMTGRYSWRSRLQSGVLGGLSPLLIEEGRLTVAELLRRHGYHTTAIGKWHLGMGWARRPGGDVNELAIETAAQHRSIDFAQPIRNGPMTVGFDRYFGISASLDMVPYAFIENDRLTQLPAADRSFPMMLGQLGKQTRPGPAAPEFEAMDVLPILGRRAVASIESRAAAARAGHPFFLYLPLNAPHTPILPAPEWQGRAGLNPYADFVMQTDACIGQILEALDRHGLADQTLVIATSDNGCSPEANFARLASAGHHPSAGFRGAKADIFEGGHRVPFVARWPGRIPAGAYSPALLCLVDFMATCADLLGVPLPPNAGEDSVSFLPVLLGRGSAPGRPELIHHSINGSFAIRQGRWKLALCPDSGGWSAPRPGSAAARNLPATQLFDLDADPGETNNLSAQQPAIVARMTALIERQVADGRSTPGPTQTNAVRVQIRKGTGGGRLPARAAAGQAGPRPQ
ncbi:MAG TPA: arylsulfatase [Candidatus Paceibacterota bacterium]|nr:arylsulfatase [Verrucomicrobiota bacterium]HRZ47388.1 arylsulfatase [Candidatus Paceibacterota bacterium]HRZ91936.1 arylsulfatase [Candidatus Paceibacterota bacterium]